MDQPFGVQLLAQGYLNIELGIVPTTFQLRDDPLYLCQSHPSESDSIHLYDY